MKLRLNRDMEFPMAGNDPDFGVWDFVHFNNTSRLRMYGKTAEVWEQLRRCVRSGRWVKPKKGQ